MTPNIKRNNWGSNRVMFGSDWPVCLQTASYEQVVEVLRYGLPAELSDSELEAIFGGNAAVFYKLG